MAKTSKSPKDLCRRAARKANRVARRTGRRLTGRKMLTVVIPLYNAMPYFKKTVESILAQTYDLRDVEVLVMDDGSTDGSLEYAEQVAAQHPDLFRVVRCGRTGGPSIPRNMGIEQAKGKYIFFCDADDYFGEDAFRRMVRHADEWKSDVLVPKLVSTSNRPIAKEPFRYGNIPNADIYKDPACDSLSPCKLFRTQLLVEKSIRFREGLSLREDDLFVEEALLKASRVSIAADYTFYYVVSRGEGVNLHSNSALDFERDYLVFTQLSALLREHADWTKVGESKYLVPRLFRFSWMGCAKAIGLCGDAATQEGRFCRLKEATSPYFAAPNIQLLPSSMRLLLRAMEANDVVYFSQLAAAIQVNDDFSFRRFDVLARDTSERDGTCYWHPVFSGHQHEIEVDKDKVEQEWDFLAASVIVPVYNKASSLAACLDSLSAQTLSSEAFEIVLVNDGSTDQSPEICEAYAATHPNVRVIHQENGGVSRARNAGIANASGKYLFFLDADDRFSDGTLRNVVKAFEDFGDQVDVVTFPISYLDEATGKTRGHKRYEWLKRTGIYPLSEYPFVAQTTMNVCVRRHPEAPVFFDEELRMGEDQWFITQNLERTAALGFCEKAKYIYVKNSSNSSGVGNNPLYAYQDMMSLYRFLMKVAADRPAMASYCYQVLLYNLDWRLRGNLLYPYALEGAQREDADKQLRAIMTSIPAVEICDSPYLDKYHKVYLLDCFGKLSGDASPVYEADGVTLSLADGAEFKVAPPKAIITQCYVEEGSVFLAGRVVCPAFLVSGPLSLWAKAAGRSLPIGLSYSSYDYHNAKEKTARAYDFYVRVPLGGGSAERIALTGGIEGAGVFPVAVERKLSRHNGCLMGNALWCVSGVARFFKDSIELRGEKLGDRLRLWRRIAGNQPLARSRGWAKAATAPFKGKRVWLYSDSPFANTGGNGLVQFFHDERKNDGIERFYVAADAGAMLDAYPQLEGRCLQLKSPEHQAVSMAAEFVFTSFLEHDTFRPMEQADFDCVGDMIDPDQTVIYLQHGVLHADLKIYIPYDRRMVDYAVVSTTMEQRTMVEQYTYPSDALIPCGMPRFDLLQPGRQQCKILFAPSWRKYLTPINDETGQDGNWDKTAFKKSKVWQGLQGLIDQVEQSGILEQLDYALDIKLHPNFKAYEDTLEVHSPRIRLVHGQIQEDSYAVVVSDFSSYIYDFLYTGAKLIYFMPDMLEFKAGLNHYRQMSVPFEEGFGPLCLTPEDVVVALREMIDPSGCDSSQAEEYARRVSHLFLHKDGKNSERLYCMCLEGEVSAPKLRGELAS